MQVFTPKDIAKQPTNKYLAVLIAAKYARVLNDFPRVPGRSGEKKLTTRSLEELTAGHLDHRIVPRRRGGGAEG